MFSLSAGNPKHSKLTAAYSYYNVPGKHALVDLMEDALILAKQVGRRGVISYALYDFYKQCVYGLKYSLLLM